MNCLRKIIGFCGSVGQFFIETFGRKSPCVSVIDLNVAYSVTFEIQFEIVFYIAEINRICNVIRRNVIVYRVDMQIPRFGDTISDQSFNANVEFDNCFVKYYQSMSTHI